MLSLGTSSLGHPAPRGGHARLELVLGGGRRPRAGGRGCYLAFLGCAGPLGVPGAKFQSTGLSSCCVFLRVQ